MVGTKPSAKEVESPATLIEKLGNAFTELQSHRDAFFECNFQWEELKQHFIKVEESLKEKSETLLDKEKSFAEKKSQTHTMLSQREEAIDIKEIASLDRIQVIKDVAVSLINEAREKYKIEHPESTEIEMKTENKVSSPLNDDDQNISDQKSPDRSGQMSVAIRLKQLCEGMDAKGLLKYISGDRKILEEVRNELPNALKNAPDPARLVLDSLEEFYPPNQTPNKGKKKDAAAILGMRRSCVLLMETLLPLLMETETEAKNPLSPEIKEQAKAVAHGWKPKLSDDDSDAANGNSLEAQAFLQLLATFNIGSEFDEDELCNFAFNVSRRKQIPELCRILGLAHKMPALLQRLVSNGRHHDAVLFSHIFQLTDTFPIVPLLKNYLEARINSLAKIKHQAEANNQELAALNVVMKCIEDYHLESEYPLAPLQDRANYLENEKTKKKRVSDEHRHAKRLRVTRGYPPRMGLAAARPPHANMFGDNFYPGDPARFSYAHQTNYAPNYPYEPHGQSVYTQPPHYAPPNTQQPYYYQDPSSYGSAPTSYGGGYMSGGLQPSHQSYM